MADQRPGPSRQQDTQQEDNRNGRKRRLSINRKKNNKRGPRKWNEQMVIRSPLLDPVLHSLRVSSVGDEMKALIGTLQPSPTEVEQALTQVKQDLACVLRLSQNQATIYEFGSIKSGLLFRDSDLDFYVHYTREKTERDEQIKLIHIISGRMEHGNSFTGMTKILGAKVPLLRAIHARTNLQCDINFSNARGCYNSKFIFAVMQFDERIHQLTLFVKFWAQCAYVLTPHKQMNSYCLIMMVIFYLQTRKLPVIPSVEDMQQGIPRINYGPWNLGYPQEIKYKTWNVNTIRELLVGFFRYYSEFDFAKNLISPFVGRLCSLEELEKKTIRELAPYYRAVEREEYPPLMPGQCMSIQDPFELNVNVGKVMHLPILLEQMKLSFKRAYEVCQRHHDQPFAKLLIMLLTDVERCVAKASPRTSPKAPVPSTSNATPAVVANGDAGSAHKPNTPVAGKTKAQTPSTTPSTTTTTQYWLTSYLSPSENELFVARQILQERDKAHTTIITEQHIRQLWIDSVMDFLVDILRDLFMLRVDPVQDAGAETNGTSVRTYQLTCERQVFISRKRITISSEADLKREIEISKQRWETNHQLQFSMRVEFAMGDNRVELRVPSNQPMIGQFRLFMDTCFFVHIHRCIRGYFMVMLEKTLEPDPDHPAVTEACDERANEARKEDPLGAQQTEPPADSSVPGAGSQSDDSAKAADATATQGTIPPGTVVNNDTGHR